MVGCLSGPSAPGRATPEPPQGGQVGRRVNGLRLLAAPHALPGALLHPGHGAAGADPGCGLLTQGAVLQAPIPQGAEPGLMLILHLGDVERLHHTLQAPLLELGALKASQEPLDVLGLQSAEPSGRGRIETREVARHLVLAELVEALRDFEGLGEDASPRRGGCGVLILLRGRLLPALRHQLTASLPLGVGHRELLLVLRQELLHGHILLRRVQGTPLGGVSGPSAPAPPQGLHPP